MVVRIDGAYGGIGRTWTIDEVVAHVGEAVVAGLIGRIDGDHELAVLTAASRRLFEFARRAPIVLLVDDEDQLPDRTRRFLRFAARRVGDWPMAICATVSVDAGCEAAAAGVSISAFEPFDIDATRRMLLPLGVSAALAQALHEGTDRQPGHLLDVLEQLDEAVRLGAARRPCPLPPTRYGLRPVRRRIDALPEGLRQTLLVVASCRTNRLDPVLAAAAGLGRGVTDIEALEGQGFIQTDGVRVTTTTRQLGAAAYWGTGSDDRGRVHRAFAAAPGIHADECLVHHAEALTEPDDTVAAGLEALAERCMQAGDLDRAIELQIRAAACSVHDHDGAHRLLRAARLPLRMGDSGRCMALVEVLRELVLPPGVRGAVHTLRGRALLNDGRAKDAVIAFLQSADLLTDDPIAASVAFTGASLAAFRYGALSRSTTYADRAARSTGSLRTGVRRTAHRILAGTYLAAGDPRWRDVRPVSDLLEGPAEFTSFGLHALTWMGNTSRAVRRLDVEVQDGSRSDRELAFSHADRAWVRYLRGAWDSALEDARIALEYADGQGDRTPVMWASAARAHVFAARGETDACLEAAQAVLTSGPRAFPALAEILAEAALGLARLGVREPGDALTHLESAARCARAARLAHPGIVPFGGDLLDARSEVEGPDAVVHPAHLLFQESLIVDAGVARVLRGHAWIRATPDEKLRAAIHHETRALLDIPAPFHRARFILAAAERLPAIEEIEASRDLAATALHTFQILDAAPWIERARGVLASLGSRRREGDRGPRVALTQTERRVARLVGTGLGNAEIAEEMVVSTKTVEYHLTNIYRKLQVGRIELIRMMRSGGDADPGTPT